MRLEAQIALITGGSGGFGQATCQRFVEEGSTVILADINTKKLEELAYRYREQSNQVKCITLDVSDFEKVELGVNDIIAEYGKIDILVNNAGYLPQNDHWLENSIEDWHKVISVNLSGEFFCARAVANQMMERKEGRIINISSSAFRHGGVPGGGGVSYTASKAGVVGLTRSLAKALGQYNITVNAIAPGLVLTPRVRRHPPEVLAEREKSIPIGRMGQPEELAHAIWYLCTPGAAFTTGAVLDVNGGNWTG